MCKLLGVRSLYGILVLFTKPWRNKRADSDNIRIEEIVWKKIEKLFYLFDGFKRNSFDGKAKREWKSWKLETIKFWV